MPEENTNEAENANNQIEANADEHSDIENQGVETQSSEDDKASESESNGPASALDAVTEGLKIAAGEDPAPDEGEGDKEAQAQEQNQDDGAAADKPASTTEGEVAEANADAGEKKELTDDELFTVPDDANERTKERIHTLIDRVKTREVELEERTGHLNGLVNEINQTGVTPEEFNQTLQFLRLSNSTNPADKQAALAMLDEQRQNLSMATGREVPGVDLLNDQPDLQEKVNTLQMTREDALQVANSRRQHARQQQAQLESQQAVNHQSQNNMMIGQGKADLDRIGTDLSKTDPDYKAIMKYVTPLISSIASAHPSTWGDSFLSIYNATKEQFTQMNQQAQRAHRPPKENRPITGANVTGAGAGQPQNMGDAVLAGLSRVANGDT